MKPPVHLAPWSAEWVVDFYQAHRQGVAGFYPSELRFVPYLARNSSRLMDVGCAAGGFVSAWRDLNPRIDYVGVDVAPELVEAARRSHPDVAFYCADAATGLPFPDAYADAVVGLGWLHLEPRWREALRELRRVAKRRILLDVRLSAADGMVGRQTPAPGSPSVEYAVFGFGTFVDAVLELGPTRILGTGYAGTPASTVSGIDGQVCFGVFVLEFGESPSEPEVALDLPLEWPSPVGTLRSVDRLRDLIGEDSVSP